MSAVFRSILKNLMHHHYFIGLLVSVIGLPMSIVAVADCVKSNNENKARWIAVIVLLPFLGSILYFQFARGKFVSDL